jgi:membrane fusion protein, copper/silver efflux system
MLQHILYNGTGSGNSSQQLLRRTLVRLVLCSAVLAMLFLTACKNKKATEATKSDTRYTCSMHPQIMQDKPGACPICHMDLIPVAKSNETKDELMLSDEQIQLGNIQTDTLGRALAGDK